LPHLEKLSFAELKFAGDPAAPPAPPNCTAKPALSAKLLRGREIGLYSV